MMLRRWFIRFLGTALSFIAGLFPLQAQSRGHSPDRLQQVDQIGQAVPVLAKGLSPQVMSAYANTEADYLNPAFWNVPPFNDSNVRFDWPKDWKADDRQGDTRLKFSWLLAKWNPQRDGTGSDHFYLRFDLKRVVTRAPEFTSQGHLGDSLYAKMTGDGLLSDKTKIRIMLSVAYAEPDYMAGVVPVHLHDLTYDLVIVDINGTPLNISVPGLKYGPRVLPTDFTVPTSALRFPVKGDSEPAPAWNVVHFKLVPPKVPSPRRYTTGYAKIPATFIQYSFTMDAELSFGAIAPIFLVHGTNATPDTWSEPIQPSGEPFVPDVASHYQASFNDYFDPDPGNYVQKEPFPGICFNDITLRPNGSIDVNSALLAEQVSKRLQSVGAKACHLIGHSKGGIDSRAMIIKHYGSSLHENLDQPGHFEVLSLYTLDTPHRGTILSDIAWNKLNKPHPEADPRWSDLEKLLRWDLPFLHSAGTPDGDALAPTGPALEAQMTNKMNFWNRDNSFDFSHKNAQGKPIRFYNTASDADWNKRDGSMDPFETAHMGIPLLGVASSMYRMLYWAKEIQARQGIASADGPYGLITIPVTTLVPVGQDPGQWNDLVVTYSSAVYDGGTLFCPTSLQNFNGINLKNHSTVKNYGMARGIVAQIALDWPVTAP